MADIQETSFDANGQENNDDMEVVTMVDVLKEEQDLEDDANAVLGGSDEKNCTYTKVRNILLVIVKFKLNSCQTAVTLK